ncbi:hypothetical protein CKA32_003633 [Geitlerinema sp. FC II]|nr:hypothetical protein CKA32_003633 [Geitlerinema sp. FC II]
MWWFSCNFSASALLSGKFERQPLFQIDRRFRLLPTARKALI